MLEGYRLDQATINGRSFCVSDLLFSQAHPRRVDDEGKQCGKHQDAYRQRAENGEKLHSYADECPDEYSGYDVIVEMKSRYETGSDDGQHENKQKLTGGNPGNGQADVGEHEGHVGHERDADPTEIKRNRSEPAQFIHEGKRFRR